MNLEDIRKLYDEGVEQHGIQPKSVGWKQKEDQYLRFSKLLKVVEDKSLSFDLNEIGCGYGELVIFLENNEYNCINYTGIDISSRMIEKAKSYVTDSKAKFVLSDRLEKDKDYCIASGIFNVKFDRTENEWLKYTLTMLDHMDDRSRLGFSFNLLSKYVDYQEDHLYYGDPLFYFHHCKTAYSSKVALYHDYDLWEWTISVSK